MKTDTVSARCRFLVGGMLAAISIVSSTLPAYAQTLTTGAVSGSILSTAGEPLANVLLTLRDTLAGTTIEITAPRNGRFRFDGLSPAVYTLTAERIGFAPLRVTQLDVRPERELPLRLVLNGVEDAVPSADERPAPVPVAPAGAGEWVPRFAVRELPGRSRTISELARFSSRLGDDLGAEGLPAWLAGMAVDGTPFRAASLWPVRSPVGAAAFTSTAFEAAQIFANPLDTEWSGTAGSLLSAYTLRGSEHGSGSVEGQWAGDVLSASSLEGGEVSWTDVRGGAVLRGGVGSGGRFSIGIDGRRGQLPVASAWQDSDVAGVLVDRDASLDVYRRAAVLSTTSIAGFARVDWPMSDRHRVEFSVHGAALPSVDVVSPGGALIEQDGMDLIAAAGVLSQLGASVHNELRASVTTSERTDASDPEIALPLTLLAHEGLALGGRPAWSAARNAHVRITDAVHIRSGAHAIKIGGDVDLGAYRYDALDGGFAEYGFGDVDEFMAGTGVLTLTETDGSADWSDRTLALFIQDRFTIAGDVEILAGVRAERQTLPGSIERDEEWERLTGIANDDVEAPGIRLSPRASAVWNIGGRGRWLLSAAGGIYYDRMDPLLLAAWQNDDGSSDVRRSVGAVSWPTANAGAGGTAARLTLLGSGFEAPRTLRLTAGLTAPLLAGTTLSVSGIVRRTENLARRTDLNLVPTAAAQDQHGREVFGTLVKQGGLVVAAPGSNRLFTTYDEVAAMITDRTSEHWGVSLTLERALGAGLGLLARYTFGRTTDDWFGARHGGWSMSAPHGLGTDSAWVEGTSDFDVPHRLAAAMLWTGPAQIRVGAVYRLESGRPFTPGFRSGVDANGDGTAGNDPAFVDESVAGTDALIGSWSCLRESAGTFAQRNACRTATVHGLDFNVVVPLVRVGRGALSARADVFDMLESSHDVPDTALYLIDPAADLSVDAATNTVSLPLVANENFGEAVANRHSGRIIRVGLSINW